jgi:hypothetical protein
LSIATADVALATDTIAAIQERHHLELAVFALYSVARGSYGSLENYVGLMETQLSGSSAYQLWYGDKGYCLLKTANLPLFDARNPFVINSKKTAVKQINRAALF